MFRYIILSSVLLLNACASSFPPMKQDAVTNLRQGTTAVAFFDRTKKIKYIEDVYKVLAITQNASSSSYKGIWKSEPYISGIHAKGLAKYGLKTKSVFKLYKNTDLNKIKAMQQKIFTGLHAESDKKHTLTPDVQKLLLKKKIQHLVLIDWRGFTLHIKTLGLSPRGILHYNFKIFNVKDGKMVWQGPIIANEAVDFKEESGKAFLEKNNLAGLKSVIRRLTYNRYISPQASVGQLMGLQAP